MKKIFIIFWLNILLTTTGFGQLYWTSAGGSQYGISGGNWNSGDRWTGNVYYHEYKSNDVALYSGNYFLIMQPDGYLQIWENIGNNRRKIWQFPAQGEGKAGTWLTLFYDDHANVGWASIGVGVNPTDAKMLIGKTPTVGGITLNLLPTDGSLYAFCYRPDNMPYVVWSAHTSIFETTSNARLPDYRRNGQDITVNSLFNDEAYSTHFTMGNIYFPGSLVFQNLAPVKFVADGYIELQPGFSTAISDNRAFTIEGMRHINRSPSLAARSTTGNNKDINGKLAKPEVEALSKSFKLNLVPNPTSGIVNIQLASKDDKVQYIKLFDSNRRLVAEYKSTATINIEKLAAGMYYYQVQTVKEGVHTGKLIKQ